MPIKCNLEFSHSTRNLSSTDPNPLLHADFTPLPICGALVAILPMALHRYSLVAKQHP
jgi:hypothetical protein